MLKIDPFLLSSRVAQKASREQKPHKATGNRLLRAHALARDSAALPRQRHLRIRVAGPSPEDQLEHQADAKFTEHTELPNSRDRENSI